MGEWSAPALPAGWTTSGQPPFVARHEEVAALEDAWADTLGGAGRAVFISGEPGSGKSRLVSEVCTRLHDGGSAVFVGACIQELGAPFEPFDQPLRVLAPAFREGATDAAELESADLLERVLERTEADAEAPFLGQERVYQAVIEVLRAAAAVRPIVLVLEDLHWAGLGATRLLGRVVEAMADSRVLLIGTLRGAPPDRSDALADTLASISRLTGVQRLDLAPLTLGDITDYVAIRSGLPVAGARESAAVLLELTGGNPFLLRAMWRPVVGAEREGDRRVIELPDSVGDMVRARASLLDDVQRSVLGLAAVLGQEVDLSEVIGISAAPVDVSLEAMDAATRTGLLEAPRQAGDLYHFPHAIARQAVIDLMPATELLRTHARIAQALEADFPAAPRLIQRLAHHYTAARALGFGDRAVTYLVRAAQLAQDRVAYEDAGRLFERASEITPDVDERAELLLRAADSWNLAADTPRARALYERVTGESGNPRVRLQAAIGYEDASWRPGLSGRHALELLTKARASIRPDEGDPLYIEALGSVARATAFTGAVDDAERIGDRALELARAQGDRQVLIAVLRSTVSMTLRPSSVVQRQERVRELLPLVRPTGSEWVGAAALQLGANAYLLGDRDGMDEAERDCVELGRRWSHHWNYWVGCLRFTRALVAGRLDDAATACQDVQRDESTFRSDATASATALQDYMVRRETGRVERVRALITGDESPTERWAPGLLALYTELGLREPASRTLEWLLRRAGPELQVSNEWPARLAFMAEATLWLEDAHAAEQLHPWLSEYAGLNLMSGLFVAPFGPADCYLGELESVFGRGIPDERFRRALDLAERSDAALHVARTLTAWAAHVRRSDPGSREAEELADRARAIAEPAGMVKVLRSLDGVIEASVHDDGGLTAREREVIRLIAEGRSNRDIAAVLVISEHTAANHVRNILTKIGVVNRTQAAMYAREHDLA